MRKNKAMRLAAILLVLTILSTCVVSGTFAKYVTSASSDDSARVAKWGIVIESTGTGFAKEYATDNKDVVGTIANSVISGTAGGNVLAPGTSGNVAKFKVSGNPEVAAKVTYTVNVVMKNWTLEDGSFYCPLRFGTADGKFVDGIDYTSEEALIKEIQAMMSLNDYQCGPNNFAASETFLNWSWIFERKDENNSSAATDIKDTYLANKIDDVTLEITVTVTVEQID